MERKRRQVKERNRAAGCLPRFSTKLREPQSPKGVGMIRANGVLQVFRGRLKRSVGFGLLILGLKREAQVDIDVTQDARIRLGLTGRLQKAN